MTETAARRAAPAETLGALAIATDDLSRAFGATKAVDGLTLQVPAATIFGLVGPDGAGKTTTIRLLCGALRPDRGTARIDGIDVAANPDGVRRHLGYVPQRFSLYGDLTVRENIRFFADIYGVPRAEQSLLMDRLLGFSRMTDFADRRADALSGGMKQKLALACALVHRPRVLLLDEPTTGVDPISRREFWDLLREAVLRDGMTVLFSTPYMDEADRCHRVGFMRDGRLLASGTPRELQELVPSTIYEIQAAPRVQAERALRAIAGVRDVQTFGDRLHLTADAPLASDLLRDALAGAGAALHSARAVTPSMEDVYLYLSAR